MAAWNKFEMQCYCVFSARRSVIVAAGGGFSVHINSLALQSLMKLPKHAHFWQIVDSQKWDTNKAFCDVDLGLQARTVRRSLSIWSNVLLFVLTARLLFAYLNPRNFKTVTCISPNGYMLSSGRLHTGRTVPLSYSPCKGFRWQFLDAGNIRILEIDIFITDPRAHFCKMWFHASSDYQ